MYCVSVLCNVCWPFVGVSADVKLFNYVCSLSNIHCHYSWYITENCDPSYELSTLGGDC